MKKFRPAKDEQMVEASGPGGRQLSVCVRVRARASRLDLSSMELISGVSRGPENSTGKLCYVEKTHTHTHADTHTLTHGADGTLCQS